MKSLRSASVAICTIAFPSFALAQVQDIGALPGGAFFANLVSADGSVIAGYSDDSVNGVKPGIWTEATGLTILDPGAAPRYVAHDLSADGSTLVGAELEPAPSIPRVATRWDLATGQRLDLGVLPGDARSSATGVSGDGSAVCGSSFSAAGNAHAFRWDSVNGMQDLGSLGGPYTTANAINADGSVIVGLSSNAAGQGRAFVWTTSGGISPIVELGDFNSAAVAVSSDGLSIVGTTAHPAFPSGAFYYRFGLGAIELQLDGARLFSGLQLSISGDGWSAAGTASVPGQGTRGFIWSLGGGPDFIGGDIEVQPTSISHDGRAAAGYSTSSGTSSGSGAFRWDRSGGIRFLDALSDSSFATASAISQDGSTVVGRSAIPTGGAHGTRWQKDGELGQSYCGPAIPNSTGAPGRMILSGTNAIHEGALALKAASLPVGAFGYFLVSTTPGYTFPVAGSQGALCLSGAIGRFVGPGQVLEANFFGEFAITVDPANLPGPQGSFSAIPGESLYFQAWYRDANPTSTSNFTSGATVRFY